MELPEIRKALNDLPPEVAARLLREVLDHVPAATPSPPQWTSSAKLVIDHYQEALKRLAR